MNGTILILGAGVMQLPPIAAQRASSVQGVPTSIRAGMSVGGGPMSGGPLSASPPSTPKSRMMSSVSPSSSPQPIPAIASTAVKPIIRFILCSFRTFCRRNGPSMCPIDLRWMPPDEGAPGIRAK